VGTCAPNDYAVLSTTAVPAPRNCPLSRVFSDQPTARVSLSTGRTAPKRRQTLGTGLSACRGRSCHFRDERACLHRCSSSRQPESRSPRPASSIAVTTHPERTSSEEPEDLFAHPLTTVIAPSCVRMKPALWPFLRHRFEHGPTVDLTLLLRLKTVVMNRVRQNTGVDNGPLRKQDVDEIPPAHCFPRHQAVTEPPRRLCHPAVGAGSHANNSPSDGLRPPKERRAIEAHALRSLNGGRVRQPALPRFG
jgi:hypothetical protein